MPNAGDIRAGGAYVEVYADPKGVKAGLDKVREQFAGSRREIKTILADLSGMQGGVARDLTVMMSEGMAGGGIAMGVAGVAAGIAIWHEYQQAMEKVAQTQREIQEIVGEGKTRMREFGEATEFANEALSAETGSKRFEEAVKNLAQSLKNLRNDYKKAAEEANKLIEGGKHDLADAWGIGNFMRGLDVLTGKAAETRAALEKVAAIKREAYNQGMAEMAAYPEQYSRQQAGEFHRLQRPGEIEAASRTDSMAYGIPLEDARRLNQEAEKYNEAVTKAREESQAAAKAIDEELKHNLAAASSENENTAAIKAAADAHDRLNVSTNEHVLTLLDAKKAALDLLDAELKRKRAVEEKKLDISATSAERKLASERIVDPHVREYQEFLDRKKQIMDEARLAAGQTTSAKEQLDIYRRARAEVSLLGDELQKKQMAEKATTQDLQDQLDIAKARTPEEKRRLEINREIDKIQYDLRAGKITKEQAALQEQIAKAKDHITGDAAARGISSAWAIQSLQGQNSEIHEMAVSLKSIDYNIEKMSGREATFQ